MKDTPYIQPPPLRVALIGGQSLDRSLLTPLLQAEDSLTIVAETGDLKGIDQALRMGTVDLVLLNFALVRDSPSVVTLVREHMPAAGIVVYGVPVERDSVQLCLRAGIRGLIDEDAGTGDLLPVLHAVATGAAMLTQRLAATLADSDMAGQPGTSAPAADVGQGLSERERAVVQLMARGASNQEIAQALDVSVHTVRAHLRTVFRKLGVANRSSAVRAALRTGLLTVDE